MSRCRMGGDGARLQRAIERIDAENAKDPRVESVDGAEVPRELLYGRRMTETLLRFSPEASESLRLAARSQHLARYRIPRARYPEGRAGYLRWRTAASKMHADRCAEILEALDYEPETIAQVQRLVRKKDLARDPEVQTLEDVACLVFLEFYLEDFAAAHEPAKVRRILARTWEKMSPRAQEWGKQLPLPSSFRGLLK